jgi:hypothetical protein
VAKPRPVVLALGLALAPLPALQAQGADAQLTARAEEVLARVRRLTTGDVAQARTVADSLVRALPADAAVMPEALFAKASIAPSASDAETDYARIVNEYRFASRVPDALMRLALLESARNNRAGALRHLDRLLRDHSESAVRSRASLMAGRMRLEMNDPARGCELLAAAWASAGLNERDVKDQAESLGEKCPVAVAERARRDPPPMGIMRAPAETTAAAVVARAPLTAAARRRQRDSVQAAQAAQAAARRDSVAKAAVAARVAQPAPPAVVRRDTAPAPKPAASAMVTVVQGARVPPATPRPDSSPRPVPAAPTPAPAAVRRDTAPAPRSTPMESAAPAGIRYAVQFAAYNDRPGAEQFARVLQQRGIAARVEGSAKPFRVRAGRFSTREEAEASMALWRRPGQPAIVVSYP